VSRGTSVALDIVISPGIEVKAIESDSLLADGDYGDAWTDFAVEAVLVHAEIRGGVTQTDEARCERGHRNAIGDRVAHAMNPETGEGMCKPLRGAVAGSRRRDQSEGQ
jgi:hypothetical protein